MENKSCEGYIELMQAVIDGEASAAEREELLAHLDQCAPCKALYEDLRDLAGATAALAVEPPPELRARVLAALSLEKGKEMKKPRVVAFGKKHGVGLFTAVAAMLTIAVFSAAGGILKNINPSAVSDGQNLSVYSAEGAYDAGETSVSSAEPSDAALYKDTEKSAAQNGAGMDEPSASSTAGAAEGETGMGGGTDSLGGASVDEAPPSVGILQRPTAENPDYQTAAYLLGEVVSKLPERVSCARVVAVGVLTDASGEKQFEKIAEEALPAALTSLELVASRDGYLFYRSENSDGAFGALSDDGFAYTAVAASDLASDMLEAGGVADLFVVRVG